jgi:hypothetical protein
MTEQDYDNWWGGKVIILDGLELRINDEEDRSLQSLIGFFFDLGRLFERIQWGGDATNVFGEEACPGCGVGLRDKPHAHYRNCELARLGGFKCRRS